MNEQQQQPVVILVAGHWLGAWAWDAVVADLTHLHLAAVPLTLPGLDGTDPQRLAATPLDQAEAVIAAMREAVSRTSRQVVLVGHSGANAPLALAMDRHAELVSRVVWVDSGPVADGSAFDPDFPDDVAEVPLPDFATLGLQASLDGLDADALQRFRLRAVSEPGPILRTPVALSNEARRRIPTTLICCSVSGEQILAMARDGHPMVAEVAQLEDVTVVDLPTGHWPMWSRPTDLARAIHDAIVGDRCAGRRPS